MRVSLFDVQVQVFPSIDEPAEQALRAALGKAGLKVADPRRSTDAWRRAAAHEAVHRDGAGGADYAFSPRSTRGATRA